MKWVDLHSHVLWQVDDGAEDIDESRLLLESAVRHGVETICLTPHINRDENKDIHAILEKVNQRFRELQELVAKEGISLNLMRGFEVYFSYDVLKLSDKELKQLCLGDSTYMLVELPFDTFAPSILTGVYELRKRGFDPIIVHPERSREFQLHPETLIDLVSRDILVQVNAASLLGANGRQIQKLSTKLVKAGLAHFIASDLHEGDDGYSVLPRCRESVARLTSPVFADLLMINNPQRVLNNQLILEPDEIYPHYLKDSRLLLDHILSPIEKIVSRIKGH